MENTVEAEGYGARGRRRLSTTRRCSCYLNFIFFLVCPAYVCICMYEIERASERVQEREKVRERETARIRTCLEAQTRRRLQNYFLQI